MFPFSRWRCSNFWSIHTSQLLKSLDVPLQVDDLYSLDTEALASMQPIYALIFLFKWVAGTDEKGGAQGIYDENFPGFFAHQVGLHSPFIHLSGVTLSIFFKRSWIMLVQHLLFSMGCAIYRMFLKDHSWITWFLLRQEWIPRWVITTSRLFSFASPFSFRQRVWQ